MTDSELGAVFRLRLDGSAKRLATFTAKYRNLQGVAVDEDGALYLVASHTPPLPSFVFKLTPRDPRGICPAA